MKVISSFLLSMHIIRCASGFSCNNSNSNLSSTNNDRGGGNLTAAQRARRDEEKRREDRKNEAIPGRTSAIPGSSDFTIDVRKTEAEWLREASSLEKKIGQFMDEGMECLQMLNIESAEKAFDAVYQLNPSAYCWQAGIAKFYLAKLEESADCFALNAALFESKFDQPASEERIWRDASELKFKACKGAKDAPSFSTIPNIGGDETQQPKETRKVIRIACDMFSASIEGDLANVIVARAKLRSICGENANEKTMSKFRRNDAKMWRFNSWFYLGLHYDVTGDLDESKKCMKMALRQCASSGNGNDSE